MRHPTDPTKWIVDTSCNNVAMALDGTYILSFLKNVVAPRLNHDMQSQWLNF